MCCAVGPGFFSCILQMERALCRYGVSLPVVSVLSTIRTLTSPALCRRMMGILFADARRSIPVLPANCCYDAGRLPFCRRPCARGMAGGHFLRAPPPPLPQTTRTRHAHTRPHAATAITLLRQRRRRHGMRHKQHLNPLPSFTWIMLRGCAFTTALLFDYCTSSTTSIFYRINTIPYLFQVYLQLPFRFPLLRPHAFHRATYHQLFASLFAAGRALAY